MSSDFALGELADKTVYAECIYLNSKWHGCGTQRFITISARLYEQCIIRATCLSVHLSVYLGGSNLAWAHSLYLVRLAAALGAGFPAAVLVTVVLAENS